MSGQAYGKIIGDGRSYQITDDDLLWLARSVHCEGGDPAATMWTYAWRLIVKQWPGTLAELVRAHSQPVNPAWDEATDPLCQRWPERCSAASLARRAQCANARWEDLPAELRQKVLTWARAGVINPAPRATDFADARVSTSFLARPANANARVVLRAGNWYIAEQPSLNQNHVTIQHAGRTAGTRITQNASSTRQRLGVALLMLAVGGGAYYVASRWV